MSKKQLDAKPKTSATLIRNRPNKLEPIKEDTLNAPATTKPQTARNDSESKGPKIPRNVNFYRHLINDKYASENDIEWVLKLRSPVEGSHPTKMEQTSTQPFSFDGQTLESQKQRRATCDLDTKNHLHQVRHLYLHRLGPSPNQGSVYFETGLRSYGSSTDKLRELEKNWRTIPKKDKKNEYPKLYPSYEETTKIKSWSAKNLTIQLHSGFEGSLNYPKYGELYDRQTKNVSNVTHILKTPGKLMATADWELSMRNYGDSTKPREFNELTDKKKKFGDTTKSKTPKNQEK